MKPAKHLIGTFTWLILAILLPVWFRCYCCCCRCFLPSHGWRFCWHANKHTRLDLLPLGGRWNIVLLLLLLLNYNRWTWV